MSKRRKSKNETKKWILPAVCACVVFLAGVITGLFLSRQKKKRKNGIQMQDEAIEDTTGAIKEETQDG